MTCNKVNAATRTRYSGHLPILHCRGVSTQYFMGFQHSLLEHKTVHRHDRV